MTGRRVKNKKAIYKYIDYFKPFLTLPAYLQDTTDVLNKMKELNSIGTASFLVTMDVESLYTPPLNMNNVWQHHFLSTRPETEMPPTEFIVSLTEWTLNHNIFQDRIFKQVKGCAMGATALPMLVCTWVNGKRTSFWILLITISLTRLYDGDAILMMFACFGPARKINLFPSTNTLTTLTLTSN